VKPTRQIAVLVSLLLAVVSCRKNAAQEKAAAEREPIIITQPGLGTLRCTVIGPAPSALPLDLPKAAAGGEVQYVFAVELNENGDTFANGKRIGEERAVLEMAREALAKNGDLRAIIRADAAVPHGRVLRMLDLLKQAGVSKIAFGVTPVPSVARSDAG
jgi:biopolymer transport protein ExbD